MTWIWCPYTSSLSLHLQPCVALSNTCKWQVATAKVLKHMLLVTNSGLSQHAIDVAVPHIHHDYCHTVLSQTKEVSWWTNMDTQNKNGNSYMLRPSTKLYFQNVGWCPCWSWGHNGQVNGIFVHRFRIDMVWGRSSVHPANTFNDLSHGIPRNLIEWACFNSNNWRVFSRCTQATESISE